MGKSGVKKRCSVFFVLSVEVNRCFLFAAGGGVVLFLVFVVDGVPWVYQMNTPYI